MVTDLPRRDTEGLLAEHVALCWELAIGILMGERVSPEMTHGKDVGHTEDADDDARGNDQTPEGRTEGTLGGVLFVQVAEDGDSNDDHDYAEGDESVARGEERPIVGGVAFEERDFGEYEEYCSFSSVAGF